MHARLVVLRVRAGGPFMKREPIGIGRTEGKGQGKVGQGGRGKVVVVVGDEKTKEVLRIISHAGANEKRKMNHYDGKRI